MFGLGFVELVVVFFGGILLAMFLLSRRRSRVGGRSALTIVGATAGFLTLAAVLFGALAVQRTVHVNENFRNGLLVQQWRAMGQRIRSELAAPLAPADPLTIVAPRVTIGADSAPADESTQTTDSSTPAELPEWITANRDAINDLDRAPLLLASDQWATVQESEEQLRQLAARAMAYQFRQQHPEFGTWSPAIEPLLESGAIQQRFVEQTSLKVGDAELPMHRSYWQVALTPTMLAAAQAEWKAGVVERRLIGLGGGAAGLTLLFGAIAVALRIDSATDGRYRKRLTFAAIGAVATLGAAALLIA